MNPDTDLAGYYARRASEYESIYAKPERQEDLSALRTLLRNQLAGHDVFEIACGTGYWTRVISETARSIVATDINEEVLEIARRKIYPRHNVTLRMADAYSLTGLDGRFTAAFASFWWSHVPKNRLRAFLNVLHEKLKPADRVIFLDNNYVEGSSTPILRRDEDGNTYQSRALENGAKFEVLKNFPTPTELRRCLGNLADDIAMTRLKYYWCVTFAFR